MVPYREFPISLTGFGFAVYHILARSAKILEKCVLKALFVYSFGYLFSVNKNSGKVFRIHTMLSIVKMKTTLVVLCVR